jgi:hypothetical protein
MSRPHPSLVRYILEKKIQDQAGKCFGPRLGLDNPKCAGDLGRPVLDHWDNNPNNNDPANLVALCRSCNTKKNPRGRGKKGTYGEAKMRSICERDTEGGKVAGGERKRKISGLDVEKNERLLVCSPEMKKNQEAEPAFRRWVRRILRRHGTLSASDVRNGGAEKVGIDPANTARRYLDKLCSIEGRFEYYRHESGEIYVRAKRTARALLEEQAENWRRA